MLRLAYPHKQLVWSNLDPDDGLYKMVLLNLNTAHSFVAMTTLL